MIYCVKLRKNTGGRKVYLVLDNARYQKCRVVQELAGQLDISLEYIPPYSPNLNLIERVWKFVKGELSSKYYDDFDMFRQKIDSTISSTDKNNKEKTDRLIGKGVTVISQPFSCWKKHVCLIK